MYDLQLKGFENNLTTDILKNIEYLKEHLDDILEVSEKILIKNLINETEFCLEQVKDNSKSYQQKTVIFEKLTEHLNRVLQHYKQYIDKFNDNFIAISLYYLKNYSTAYFRLFGALFFINEGKTGQYKDDLERVVKGFNILAETIDVFYDCFSISTLKQIYESAKHTIFVSERNQKRYWESELELSNLFTQLRAYSSLIILKLKDYIEQSNSSFDFWESVQEFREKNNLDEEGIEPEEWLQNLRDDAQDVR
ncbi:hypothetical protein [Gloeothece verrucosa]|uniref:Uncharacterized protein n=1 Tax=Gloeothece verrucosa (strain PCC 7822) TaxID=497965 RepID=E0UG20_GLOV7|nr:hypothetical protein [Gloeothece verrucosa]ADN15521.1 conserved hypothetical protein [Gloeothece verrucosa PCC 7822]